MIQYQEPEVPYGVLIAWPNTWTLVTDRQLGSFDVFMLEMAIFKASMAMIATELNELTTTAQETK
jgi:hypothetical protein